MLVATKNARPAAASISVLPALILKQSPSTVSATTAHILATPAAQAHQSAHHASLDSTLSELPVLLPALLVPTPKTESASAQPAMSTPIHAFLNAQLALDPLEVNAPNALTTAPAAQDHPTLAIPALTDMLLIKSVESARRLLHANSDSTSLNLPIPALVSALLEPTSMKTYA